ncbi:MAG: hypothetical protein M1833_001151 [Piccolia ochrophora]|nr:MAG: hypothetical protein M1833_001151 [Piccolia ochrophora]
MPGILPMKVIKVGSSSQSRIAQACDRCRSKKIRCDGIRPTCSQCGNVGFECKTSDKLSRRAFPRGYTESLEERVRALENEVRELKDLLDEKDEKIDMLSKMHSHASFSAQGMGPPRRKPSSTSPAFTEQKSSDESSPSRDEEKFRVSTSSSLQDGGTSDSYFVGASSSKAFLDTFKRMLQERGKDCTNLKSESLLDSASKDHDHPSPQPASLKPPPRLVSDQLINIFFQEWAPLFPVVHRPTLLQSYDEYLAKEEPTVDGHCRAMLHLIFGIAAISSEPRIPHDRTTLEAQWRSALDGVVKDPSIATLQCLVLAQIYCMCSGDYARLLRYKSLAVGLSHRLGLHQSQKRFSFGALTSETRKRVFWCLYTVDCFSAAVLGLPKLLKDDDVHAEYPTDADDEYVTEKGFLPTLPGETSRMSSALALFRISRILSNVLEKNYPVAASHELSLQGLSDLQDDLDSWSKGLGDHLKLRFVQDKPATNVTGSRAPILSASSLLAIADSSKHIIQIFQLLEERRLSLSFCMNKNEILILSAFGLLLQALDLNHDSKVFKDAQKSLSAVLDLLEGTSSSVAPHLREIAHAIVPLQKPSRSAKPIKLDRRPVAPTSHPGSIRNSANAPLKPSHNRLQSIASRFTLFGNRSDDRNEEPNRRATVPRTTLRNNHELTSAHPGVVSVRSDSAVPRVDPKSNLFGPLDSKLPIAVPNLDYLPFDTPDAQNCQTRPPDSSDRSVSTSNWERFLGSIDGTHYDMYTNAPDDPKTGPFVNFPATPGDVGSLGWATESLTSGNANAPPAQSISSESLTSGEDLSSCDLNPTHNDPYQGVLMPNLLGEAGFGLSDFDGHFAL